MKKSINETIFFDKKTKMSELAEKLGIDHCRMNEEEARKLSVECSLHGFNIHIFGTTRVNGDDIELGMYAVVF